MKACIPAAAARAATRARRLCKISRGPTCPAAAYTLARLVLENLGKEPFRPLDDPDHLYFRAAR